MKKIYKCFKCNKEISGVKSTKVDPQIERCVECGSTLTKVVRRVE